VAAGASGKLGQRLSAPPTVKHANLRVSGGREAFARDGVCQHERPNQGMKDARSLGSRLGEVPMERELKGINVL
jgi:hypothetical protein